VTFWKVDTDVTFALIKDRTAQLDSGYLDRTPILQFVLLSLCFPMWGAAASLNDVLITQFRTIFDLSNFASAFVQSAFYGGYFVVAIPASRVIRNWSYKSGILIGLATYIIGCTLFFPASTAGTYGVFLAALFAMAIGLSFLETSANTFSTMMGPQRFSTLRLNISQTVLPFGSIAGVVLGKYFIFTDGEPLEAQLAKIPAAEQAAFAADQLQRTLQPYRIIIIALAVLLVLVAITEFPRCKPKALDGTEARAPLGQTLGALARNSRYREGIVAQFLYVGLQTAIWTFTIRVALNVIPGLNERDATNYLIFAYIAFFLGKLIADFFMTRFSSESVLMTYTLLGAASLLVVMFVPNVVAAWAAVLASGLLGPCWPTIFGRTLESIEDRHHAETGGAILVMAIIGGAVIPVVQGLVADLVGSVELSFGVSAVCFLAIFAFFARNRKSRVRELAMQEHDQSLSREPVS